MYSVMCVKVHFVFTQLMFYIFFIIHFEINLYFFIFAGYTLLAYDVWAPIQKRNNSQSVRSSSIACKGNDYVPVGGQPPSDESPGNSSAGIDYFH